MFCVLGFHKWVVVGFTYHKLRKCKHSLLGIWYSHKADTGEVALMCHRCGKYTKVPFGNLGVWLQRIKKE